MELKIKRLEKQNQDSDFVRIKAKLIADDLDSIDECAWSIRSTNPETLLIHSGDADEETYLNYADKFSPDIEVILPDDNSHTIIVLAEVMVFSWQDVPIVKLDEDGEAFDVMDRLYVPEITYLKSNPIDIKKFKVIEDWV